MLCTYNNNINTREINNIAQSTKYEEKKKTRLTVEQHVRGFACTCFIFIVLSKSRRR